MDSVRAAGSSRSIPRRRKPKNKILLSIWRRKEKREEKISQNGKSVLHIMSYTVPVIYTYWVNKQAFNQKGWGGGGGGREKEKEQNGKAVFHITSYTVPLRLRQPSTPYQKSYKLCVAIRSLTKLRSKRVLFLFSSSFHRFPPRLDYSLLSQHPLLWFCQEPWSHSWLKPVHEEVRHKNLSNCLFRA